MFNDPDPRKNDRLLLEYRTLINNGIADVKEGKHDSARELLLRATELVSTDPVPWLWLSRTTPDAKEQLKYLEYAVAADPFDARARSAISEFKARQRGVRLHNPQATPAPAETVERKAESYTCPKCSGRMVFLPTLGQLECTQCGHQAPVKLNRTTSSDKSAIEFALIAEAGHAWARNHQQAICDNCGAVSMLPPTQKTNTCPYCGSNQLVSHQLDQDMIPPRSILPFALDNDTAYQRFNRWLSGNFFAPDNLGNMAKNTALRQAYYPFWLFDATYHANYSVEINEGTSRNPRWVSHSGTEVLFYDDTLVPGNSRITLDDLKGIEPFDLKALIEYDAAVLAGWPAFMYDTPLADAAIRVRGKIAEHARPKISRRVAAGRETRNLEISTGDFSSKTFKLVFMPLWVGVYQYNGQEYHVVVNGQTGKVGGKRPIDTVKIWLLLAMVGMVGFMILLYLVLANWNFLFG